MPTPDPQSPQKSTPRKMRWWEMVVAMVAVVLLWKLVLDPYVKEKAESNVREAFAAEQAGRAVARTWIGWLRGTP